MRQIICETLEISMIYTPTVPLELLKDPLILPPTVLINIDFKILVHIGIFFITSACSRDFQMYVNVLHIGKENSHIDSFQYYYNNIIA